MIKHFFPSLFIAVAITSCGTVDAVKQTAVNAGKSVKNFSLADLRPSQIDIIDVREDDLKEMPLGKDQAIAYEKKRERSFWSFAMPNFKEPSLPDISEGDMDGSLLLPPKSL